MVTDDRLSQPHAAEGLSQPHEEPKFAARRIAGCVCPDCAGSGRPPDAAPPHEPWVLLFDRCPSCEGSGAALEEPVDSLSDLPPNPRMIAPRALIDGNARVGMVGEIIDGVGQRRACVIDSQWRQTGNFAAVGTARSL